LIINKKRIKVGITPKILANVNSLAYISIMINKQTQVQRDLLDGLNRSSLLELVRELEAYDYSVSSYNNQDMQSLRDSVYVEYDELENGEQLLSDRSDELRLNQ